MEQRIENDIIGILTEWAENPGDTSFAGLLSDALTDANLDWFTENVRDELLRGDMTVCLFPQEYDANGFNARLADWSRLSIAQVSLRPSYDPHATGFMVLPVRARRSVPWMDTIQRYVRRLLSDPIQRVDATLKHIEYYNWVLGLSAKPDTYMLGLLESKLFVAMSATRAHVTEPRQHTRVHWCYENVAVTIQKYDMRQLASFRLTNGVGFLLDPPMKTVNYSEIHVPLRQERSSDAVIDQP